MDENKSKTGFFRSKFGRRLLYASFIAKIVDALDGNVKYEEFVNNNETIIAVFMYVLISIVVLYFISIIITKVLRYKRKRLEKKDNERQLFL